MSFTIDPIFGCHVWAGKLGSNGRPIVWLGRKPSSAHKLAYERDIGPVAAGLVLDHLCRNPLCVRALHLEAVTRHENELRKSWGYRVRRTRCPVGHDMSDALVTPHFGRLCRACMPSRSPPG